MSSPERWTSWRKSSFSDGGNGACVEVAFAVDVVGVRDSKNPGGPRLEFPRGQWLPAVGVELAG